MRLLQAMAGAEVGGAEEFFVRLALAFSRGGVEQRIVTRHHARRTAALAAAALAPVELPFGSLFDFRTRPELAREIAAFRPDIVLTWMSRATRHCPRATASRRFVHIGRLGGYYNLKYYRRCDHLVGNTLDIVDHLVARGWPKDRVHYLPNFVDATPIPAVARVDLRTPEDVPLLLAAGRLHPNKAFDVLIRALPHLPEVVLWLAGEGPLEGELVALARREGVEDRVRFLGWRDDVPALLAAADALVCPSRSEPLGNVILEAWAHGRPVIAANSLGPKALIRSGENGILVPADDPGALAAAIELVLHDRTLAARLAAGGRESFARRYTEAAVVRRWLDFFAAVVR
jgi:glycosyltransferase involved in cell wall biosynthesis